MKSNYDHSVAISRRTKQWQARLANTSILYAGNMCTRRIEVWPHQPQLGPHRIRCMHCNELRAGKLTAAF